MIERFSVVSDSSGTVNDGSYSLMYENNHLGGYLIDVPGARSLVIRFEEFSLEPGDTLKIYDGENVFHPFLGAYSGGIFPPEIKSSTGKLFLLFTTDFTGIDNGWTLNYEADFPPILPERVAFPKNDGPVFPGDANNDGVVDETDFFIVSQAQKSLGPPRKETGEDFRPYERPQEWSSVRIVYGMEINDLYSDCNGDGVIDPNDIEITIRNRGKSVINSHPVLAANLEIIDSTQLYLVSTEAETDSGLFKFKVLAPYPNKFEKEDIITGAQSFLRRIKEMDIRPDSVIFKTVPAMIYEAIPIGGFKAKINADSVVRRGSSNDTLNAKTSEDCDDYKVRFESDDKSAYLELSAGVDFQPDYYFNYETATLGGIPSGFNYLRQSRVENSGPFADSVSQFGKQVED